MQRQPGPPGGPMPNGFGGPMPNGFGGPMQNGFGGPMQNGFGGPMQNGFGGPMPPQGQAPGPMRRPSWAGPCFGGPIPNPQQQQPQGPGCFMPAATIRKISNTTPPAQFFNNPN